MAYIPPNPNGQATKANSSPVTLASDQEALPLSTGASSSAKQDTGNTSVASIDTKTPALGQALAAASVPVVLTAAQLTTITPPAAITGYATSAKQDTGNTSLASIDGKITAVNTGAVVISSSALPTGAATSANQATEITSLASIVTNTGASATSANQTNGNQQVQGNIASAATDSGNPIKVGARYDTTLPTYTNGQRTNLQTGTRGSINATLFAQDSGVANTFIADNVDTVAVSSVANKMSVMSRATVFNGTSWDRTPGTTAGAYTLIRDAAGNARGANVTASNELVVSDSGLRPAGASLNTYSVHLTTNTTTTPTSSTAYISSVTLSSEVAGTTSTVTIQDKQGTPLKLINGFSTTTLTTTPTVVNFQTPVKMTSGIDIITAGAVAATVDIWVNYYQ